MQKTVIIIIDYMTSFCLSFSCCPFKMYHEELWFLIELFAMEDEYIFPLQNTNLNVVRNIVAYTGPAVCGSKKHYLFDIFFLLRASPLPLAVSEFYMDLSLLYRRP